MRQTENLKREKPSHLLRAQRSVLCLTLRHLTEKTSLCQSVSAPHWPQARAGPGRGPGATYCRSEASPGVSVSVRNQAGLAWQGEIAKKTGSRICRYLSGCSLSNQAQIIYKELGKLSLRQPHSTLKGLFGLQTGITHHHGLSSHRSASHSTCKLVFLPNSAVFPS